MITLARNLKLPDEIVTQAIGILAKRRAGKSYTARRLTEQLAEGGHQVVIIDPKGDWWGIRSSANGKRRGLPITIFGGERGDVPLEKAGGELVARLVAEKRVSALLDLSDFRKGEVAVFMADFLEALYRLKRREAFRTPLMLIVDEADAIAPQKPQPNEARMLGAAEDIVRRGGQRGIGCTMITQRSAVLNKNVLTMIDMLIALRTIAPHDRKAVKEWIDIHGDVEQGKVLMDSLASLPVGDAWVWSPGDGIFQRVSVSPIKTFDSGASPKPGEKRVEPTAVADVDLDAVRAEMAEVVERAAASDPKALRLKIRDLERELESSTPPQARIDEAALERIRDEARAAAQASADEQVGALQAEAREIAKRAREAIDSLTLVEEELSVLVRRQVAVPQPEVRRPAARLPVSPPQSRSENRNSASKGSAPNLGGGCLRMLVALASRAPAGFTEAQWATLSKLKRTGGTWGSYKSRLKTAGYVEQRGELWHATDDGIAAAGEVPPAPETPEELLAMWKSNVGGGAARMLDAIALTGDRWIDLDDLAERVGITRSGGTFGSYLSRLNSNGLIEKRSGEVRLSEVLR